MILSVEFLLRSHPQQAAFLCLPPWPWELSTRVWTSHEANFAGPAMFSSIPSDTQAGISPRAGLPK